jgi:hypothetical protein
LEGRDRLVVGTSGDRVSSRLKERGQDIK